MPKIYSMEGLHLIMFYFIIHMLLNTYHFQTISLIYNNRYFKYICNVALYLKTSYYFENIISNYVKIHIVLFEIENPIFKFKNI